jgi:hypothetical protein
MILHAFLEYSIRLPILGASKWKGLEHTRFPQGLVLLSLAFLVYWIFHCQICISFSPRLNYKFAKKYVFSSVVIDTIRTWNTRWLYFASFFLVWCAIRIKLYNLHPLFMGSLGLSYIDVATPKDGARFTSSISLT